jgi:hypothetical protein
MIAVHDLLAKRLTIMDAEVSTHTFLTIINCIILKIRSKADFKSKSKNI